MGSGHVPNGLLNHSLYVFIKKMQHSNKTSFKTETFFRKRIGGNSWRKISMDYGKDLDHVDWSNEESVRYLSAINCLHNYAVGKCTEHELDHNGDNGVRKQKPSKNMFLSFAETLEQIKVLDADAICLSQNMGSISEMTNQEVRSVQSVKDFAHECLQMVEPGAAKTNLDPKVP